MDGWDSRPYRRVGRGVPPRRAADRPDERLGVRVDGWDSHPYQLLCDNLSQWVGGNGAFFGIG